MRVVLIGAVGSTEVVLQKLIEHDTDTVGVFGYHADVSQNVSGYVSLKQKATESNIPFFSFKRINDHAREIITLRPDILFVIGLSQIVSEDIINIPTICCVGFHPTQLPRGRGRGAVAWLVLDRDLQGASTLFRIGQGVDDGPVFIQEKFYVMEQDDAKDVGRKLKVALGVALDRWLPALKSGILNSVEQNETDATYYGRRAPEDGLIDWGHSSESIDRLIKSAAFPHPGAFTYCDNKKVIIWKSRIEHDLKFKGVRGRILHVLDDGSLLVQCGSGLVVVCSYEVEDGSRLTVGKKLGYHVELEIYTLQQEIKKLKNELDNLKKNV